MFNIRDQWKEQLDRDGIDTFVLRVSTVFNALNYEDLVCLNTLLLKIASYGEVDKKGADVVEQSLYTSTTSKQKTPKRKKGD